MHRQATSLTKALNGTHISLFAALHQSAELDPHAVFSTGSLEITKTGFFCHDLSVHRTYIVTQFVQRIRLRLEILVFGAHLAKLAVRRVGIRLQRLSTPFEVV